MGPQRICDISDEIKLLERIEFAGVSFLIVSIALVIFKLIILLA